MLPGFPRKSSLARSLPPSGLLLATLAGPWAAVLELAIPSGRLAGTAALALLIACSSSERGVTGPPDDGPPDGTTQSALTVSVVVDPSGGELAAELGWEDGVPGAEVRILRNGTRDWVRATADESGRAVFPKVLPGRYRIVAGRRLESGEADAAGTRVRAFGDGRTEDISGASPAVELRLAPDRETALVIAEIGYGKPPDWELVNTVAKAGLFFEIYNQSEETRFLDGVVYGIGQPFVDDGFDSCAFTEPVRTDPTGVIFQTALAFPGSGGEYPIGPGELKLVAMVAADHRSLHEAMPDLSGADFEIALPGLADNPAVPNMLDVGIDPLGGPGRWTALLATRWAYFLAEPLSPASLPVSWRDRNGNPWVKAPAEKLYDVVATDAIWPDRNLDGPPCIPRISPVFDRYASFNQIGFDVDASEKAFESFQRRVLRSEGGRLILQDTNTSAVDFEVGTKTPGSISG